MTWEPPPQLHRQALSDERQGVQAELKAMNGAIPELPSAGEIARMADEQLARMASLFESGTLEEKQEFVRTYVKAGKADPKAKVIELTFMPSLFNTVGPVGWSGVRVVIPGVPFGHRWLFSNAAFAAGSVALRRR